MEPALLHHVRLQGDQADELSVVADDVHIVPFAAVEGDRTDDVVQHRVGINAAVHEFPDMQLLIARELNPEGIRIAGQGDQGLELLGGHGTVVIEALHIPAADILQVTDQDGTVHAFHDQGNGQGSDHADDGFEDIEALPVLTDGEAEELRIQLDDVHIDGAQHSEGGIAAAEIVHHDEEAAAAQLSHRGPDPGFVLHVGGFSDLHLDQGSVQPVFFQQAGQHRRNVDAEDAHPAYVQGDRNRPDAAVDHAPQPDEDLLPDIGIQVGDDAVLFQYGNEDGRGQEGAVRTLPAGQRLSADDPAGLDVDLGLDVEGDLPA